MFIDFLLAFPLVIERLQVIAVAVLCVELLQPVILVQVKLESAPVVKCSSCAGGSVEVPASLPPAAACALPVVGGSGTDLGARSASICRPSAASVMAFGAFRCEEQQDVPAPFLPLLSLRAGIVVVLQASRRSGQSC